VISGCAVLDMPRASVLTVRVGGRPQAAHLHGAYMHGRMMICSRARDGCFRALSPSLPPSLSLSLSLIMFTAVAMGMCASKGTPRQPSSLGSLVAGIALYGRFFLRSPRPIGMGHGLFASECAARHEAWLAASSVASWPTLCWAVRKRVCIRARCCLQSSAAVLCVLCVLCILCVVVA
jgi:hypothetical protein